MIISSDIVDLLNLYFEEIDEFLEQKYKEYNKDFKKEIKNIYGKNTDFFLKLDPENKRHLAFLFKLLLLFDRYGLTKAYLSIFHFLEYNNIDLSGIFTALKIANSTQDFTQNKNNFSNILSELNLAFENDEDPKILNYILKNYVFNELKLSKTNLVNYDELLSVFEEILLLEIPFLDIEFFSYFLKNAKNRKEFITNWQDKIRLFEKQNLGILEDINEDYLKYIKEIKNMSFDSLWKLCFNECRGKGIQNTTNHGTKLLESHEELMDYIRRYGKMHQEKLKGTFKNIINKLQSFKRIKIIDYACGQGMGTMVLADFIKENNLKCEVAEVVLVEPSQNALQRAILHTKSFLPNVKIKSVSKFLNDLNIEDLKLHDDSLPTIQIFSNILDMEEVKLDKNLYSIIESSLSKNNIFICVSPKISTFKNNRLDIFYLYFKDNYGAQIISNDVYGKIERNHTKYERSFEVIK